VLQSNRQHSSTATRQHFFTSLAREPEPRATTAPSGVPQEPSAPVSLGSPKKPFALRRRLRPVR